MHSPKWLLLSEAKVPENQLRSSLMDTEHSADTKIAFKFIDKLTRCKALKYAKVRAIKLHKTDLCV